MFVAEPALVNFPHDIDIAACPVRPDRLIAGAGNVSAAVIRDARRWRSSIPIIWMWPT